MMDYKFLGKIREAELYLIIEFFPKDGKILELGAGSGWQAKKMSQLGYDITAVDIEQQSTQNYNYESERVFDVVMYDGYTLPFPDRTFDCVYSSNVLEHIFHVEDFQNEIRRVLKNDGICIHTMPTPSWRFWSFIVYYVLRFKNILSRDSKKEHTKGTCLGDGLTSKMDPLIKRLIIRRHGERGNVLSEFYLFSRIAWKRLFKRAGWEIVKVISSYTFYSGEYFFGPRISIKTRRRLGRFIGAPINIYILRNGKK